MFNGGVKCWRENTATKVEKILSVFENSSNPLTVSDIQRATGIKRTDRLVHNLWRKGRLLASDVKYILTLENSGGSWKWSRKRQRWYILANGEESVTISVSYMEHDKRFGKNVEITE